MLSVFHLQAIKIKTFMDLIENLLLKTSFYERMVFGFNNSYIKTIDIYFILILKNIIQNTLRTSPESITAKLQSFYWVFSGVVR